MGTIQKERTSVTVKTKFIRLENLQKKRKKNYSLSVEKFTV